MQKQLYLLLLPYLRAIANRYLRDTSYTKDVLQESFIKIFGNLKDYDEKKAPIKSWAARIVINQSLNYNTRIIKEINTTIEDAQNVMVILPSALTDLSEKHLLHVLKKMPEDYFVVFNLFVIEEYHHDEIASFLNIKESLSRKRLSRARSWIKNNIRSKSPHKDEIISSFNNLN